MLQNFSNIKRGEHTLTCVSGSNDRNRCNNGYRRKPCTCKTPWVDGHMARHLCVRADGGSPPPRHFCWRVTSQTAGSALSVHVQSFAATAWAKRADEIDLTAGIKELADRGIAAERASLSRDLAAARQERMRRWKQDAAMVAFSDHPGLRARRQLPRRGIRPRLQGVEAQP